MLRELFAEHGVEEASQTSIGSHRTGPARQLFAQDLPDELAILRKSVVQIPSEVAVDVDMEPPCAQPEPQEIADPISTSLKTSQVEVDRESVQSQCKAAWLVHLGPVRCHRSSASLRRGPWQELRAAAEDVQVASET